MSAPGRTELCAHCRAELRCCLNCGAFDPLAAAQCRDRRAEPVMDKDRGNYCEFFQFALRLWKAPVAPTPREAAARAQLRSLLE